MGASPAAAAIPERLDALLERSHPGLGRELAGRLLPAISPADTDADHEFSWLMIPRWLAAGFDLDATAAGRALVDDLCWLQFCVYGLFRIQDDLVDGETADPTLVVRANTLWAEAARCAARHFEGSSPFWPELQAGVDGTSHAIVALERLQRAADRDPEAELRLYAELSASLKIAAAGVAFAVGKEAEWREQLSPALDAFAIATQIVDDLRDVREDLEAGCVNHAAWFLSHPVFSVVPDAIEAVIASNLATTDRLDHLLAHTGALMDRALDRLDPQLCPPMREHLVEYRQGLVGLGQRIQRSRVVVLAGSARNR